MSVEDRLLETVEEEEMEECEPSYLAWRRQQRERMRRKNEATINGFLGKGGRTGAVGLMPSYYADLLAWALQRHLDREGWKTVDSLGYRSPEPFYADVGTDYDKQEALLVNGQLLVEKDGIRLVITVDASPHYGGCVQVQGPEERKKTIENFVEGIMTIARKENFYRGKKIEFGERIRFCLLYTSDAADE